MWENLAHFGKYISSMLDQVMQIGITSLDAVAFVNCIIFAGPGDYVEIGTAFGGSAILAALTKRVYQIPGEVYTIDNFKRGISPVEVNKYATIFGVDDMINIVVGNSHPWPLGDKKFACGFVDGSHKGLMPAKDFINMSKRITKYIMIDDIGYITHPNIAKLVHSISKRDEWGLVKATSKLAIFKRVFE